MRQKMAYFGGQNRQIMPCPGTARPEFAKRAWPKVFSANCESAGGRSRVNVPCKRREKAAARDAERAAAGTADAPVTEAWAQSPEEAADIIANGGAKAARRPNPLDAPPKAAPKPPADVLTDLL
jgi:hypothetical protein